MNLSKNQQTIILVIIAIIVILAILVASGLIPLFHGIVNSSGSEIKGTGYGGSGEFNYSIIGNVKHAYWENIDYDVKVSYYDNNSKLVGTTTLKSSDIEKTQKKYNTVNQTLSKLTKNKLIFMKYAEIKLIDPANNTVVDTDNYTFNETVMKTFYDKFF